PVGNTSASPRLRVTPPAAPREPPASARPPRSQQMSIPPTPGRRKAETDPLHPSAAEVRMNVALWILQVLLAAVFAAHGWMLLAPPPDLLALMNEQMGVPFRIF